MSLLTNRIASLCPPHSSHTVTLQCFHCPPALQMMDVFTLIMIVTSLTCVYKNRYVHTPKQKYILLRPFCCQCESGVGVTNIAIEIKCLIIFYSKNHAILTEFFFMYWPCIIRQKIQVINIFVGVPVSHSAPCLREKRHPQQVSLFLFFFFVLLYSCFHFFLLVCLFLKEERNE